MLYKRIYVNYLAIKADGADGAGGAAFASSPNIWYLCRLRRHRPKTDCRQRQEQVMYRSMTYRVAGFTFTVKADETLLKRMDNLKVR